MEEHHYTAYKDLVALHKGGDGREGAYRGYRNEDRDLGNHEEEEPRGENGDEKREV